MPVLSIQPLGTAGHLHPSTLPILFLKLVQREADKKFSSWLLAAAFCAGCPSSAWEPLNADEAQSGPP